MSVAVACGVALIVSFAFRHALIPLSLKVARRVNTPVQQANLADLKPQFGGLFAAINTPLRAGLGAGKRFQGIADLSRPDVLLAVVASALVAGSVALAPQTGEGAQAATMFRFSIVLAAVMTLVMLLSSSAAIVVGVAGGAGVQGWVGPRGRPSTR